MVYKIGVQLGLILIAVDFRSTIRGISHPVQLSSALLRPEMAFKISNLLPVETIDWKMNPDAVKQFANIPTNSKTKDFAESD